MDFTANSLRNRSHWSPWLLEEPLEPLEPPTCLHNHRWPLDLGPATTIHWYLVNLTNSKTWTFVLPLTNFFIFSPSLFPVVYALLDA